MTWNTERLMELHRCHYRHNLKAVKLCKGSWKNNLPAKYFWWASTRWKEASVTARAKAEFEVPAVEKERNNFQEQLAYIRGGNSWQPLIHSILRKYIMPSLTSFHGWTVFEKLKMRFKEADVEKASSKHLLK